MHDERIDNLEDLEPVEPAPTDLVLATFFRALIDDLEVPARVRLHALRGYRDLTGFRGEFYPDQSFDCGGDEDHPA